jgi:hypothetical protein
MKFKFSNYPTSLLKLEGDEVKDYSFCFTTRQGGISTGPYSSMNLGLNTEDNPDFVNANYTKLLRQLKIPQKEVCHVKQVHGSQVVKISETMPTTLIEADAMVTNVPGRVLYMNFADCLPLFLAAEDQTAIALVHCGWRGIVGGIVKKSLFSLERNYEVQPENVRAVLAPSICQKCFSVGEDVARQFYQQFSTFPELGQLVELRQGGGQIDLAGIVKAQLINSGVRVESIVTSEFCTSCSDHLFFSHRRDQGLTGRMAALAMINRGGF